VSKLNMLSTMVNR